MPVATKLILSQRAFVHDGVIEQRSAPQHKHLPLLPSPMFLVDFGGSTETVRWQVFLHRDRHRPRLPVRCRFSYPRVPGHAIRYANSVRTL